MIWHKEDPPSDEFLSVEYRSTVGDRNIAGGGTSYRTNSDSDWLWPRIGESSTALEPEQRESIEVTPPGKTDSHEQVVTPVEVTDYGLPQPPFTKEQWNYWRGKPPKRIIVATGSGRKAKMVKWALLGGIPDDVKADVRRVVGLKDDEPILPLHFQRYFNETMPNGNGALKEITHLGFFQGVEVMAQPQHFETNGNNHREEAENKVLGVAGYYLPPEQVRENEAKTKKVGKKAKNKQSKKSEVVFNINEEERRRVLAEVGLINGDDLDVIVISTDTIEKSEQPTFKHRRRGEHATATEHEVVYLGKPQNLMPKIKEIFDHPQDWKYFIKHFKKRYLELFYRDQQPVFNINGVSIYRTGREFRNKTPHTREFILSQHFFERHRQIIDVILDCGGGGVTQQIIPWTEKTIGEILDEIGDEPIKEVLGTLAKTDPESATWWLYFQISGMPWWAIAYSIDEFLGHHDQGAMKSGAVEVAKTVGVAAA